MAGKMIGKISLIVAGEKIYIEKLDAILELKHTVYRKKGEKYSNILNVLQNDVAEYMVEINEASIDSTIFSFCKKISKKIGSINDQYLCKLRIYLQSYDAQIYWKLGKETMEAIQECGVDCEFSILSWGECS